MRRSRFRRSKNPHRSHPASSSPNEPWSLADDRRTGATQWGLFRNGERPGDFEEIFVVSSWDEHLRQHRERLTATDIAYEEQAKALSDAAPQTWHLPLPTSTSVRHPLLPTRASR